MSNNVPSKKLADFYGLLNSIEITSHISDEECVTFRVLNSLSNNEIDSLNSNGFSIRSASSRDKSPLKVSALTEVAEGSNLKVEVPRNRNSVFVAQDYNDLIADNISLTKEPKEYLILSRSNHLPPYWSSSQDVPPNKILSYRNIQKLINILILYSDGHSKTPLTVT